LVLRKIARAVAGGMSLLLVGLGTGAALLIVHHACVLPSLDSVVGGGVMLVLCTAVAYGGYAVGALARSNAAPRADDFLPEARQVVRTERRA